MTARTLGLPSLLLLVAMFCLTLPVAGLKELVLDELGGTVGDAALFLSIEMAAYVLCAPLWGLWSDKSGRRKPFVVIGFAINAALYGVATTLETVDSLLVLRFFQGAASVMGWSTLMALVVDHAPAERRGRTLGMMGAALMLGVGLGAPMGGYVSRDLGPRGPLWVGAVLFALIAFGALGLREAPSRTDRITGRAVFAALRATPRLLWPWGFYLIDRLTIGLFLVALPLHLAALGNDSPVLRGRYLALFLLPFALLQPFSGRLAERFGPLRPLVWGSLGYGLALAAVGWAGQTALWPAMALLGILAAVMFPPTMMLTAAWSPPEARASGMAGFNLAGSLGFAIGPVVGAWAQSHGGYQLTFLLAGGLEITMALAALPFLLRRDRQATLAP